MIKQIKLICAFLSLFLLNIKSSNAIQIAYYDLAPYIYEDKNGTMVGIIPEIMKALSLECDMELNYSRKIDSAKTLSTLMKDIKKMQSISGDWIWLPLTQHVPKKTIKTLNLTALQILYSGIDILIHRNHFKVFWKVKVGLFKCFYLIVTGFMLSIIFGLLIWFAERWRNTDFSKIYHGIFTGLWFATVTVTTVGYGDIAPKSVIGKLLTMTWMVSGIIFTAILTSTITNAFEGLDEIDISHKIVVALDGSLEAWFSKEEYSANIESVSNYDHLFDGLIKRKFDYGVVDSNIRRKHQEKLSDLRVATKLKYFMQGIYYLKSQKNSTSDPLIDCVQAVSHIGMRISHKYELLANKKLESELDVTEVFSEPSILVVTIVAGSCVVLYLLFDTVVFLKRYMKRSSTSANDTDQIGRSALNHFGVDRKNKNDPRQLKDLACKDDINELSRKIDDLREELNKPINDMQQFLNKFQSVQLQKR